MIFRPTEIPGAFVIDVERLEDDRGFFARTWCREEFRAHGIEVDMVQASVSHNRKAGTLRGLHFSLPPSNEGKLVRCERGRVFDVIVDLRPDSPAFCQHVSVELDAQLCNALFIPHGCAHGFQTMQDDCDVLYMMTDQYRADLASGVRYDDPAFAIAWPCEITVIAERDRTYASFDLTQHRLKATVAAATDRSDLGQC